MAELPLDVEERLARLEKLFNKLNTPPMDLLLQEGYLQIGNSSTPGAVRMDGKSVQIAGGDTSTDYGAIAFVPYMQVEPLGGNLTNDPPKAYITGRATTSGFTRIRMGALDPEPPSSGELAFASVTVETPGSTHRGQSTLAVALNDAGTTFAQAQLRRTGGDDAGVFELMGAFLQFDVTALPLGDPANVYTGAFWYNATENKFKYVEGSTIKTLGGGMSVIVKEADETITSNNTLQDDDELAFSVGANEVFQFEGVLNITTPAAADFRIGITGPTGATGSISAIYSDLATGSIDAGSVALGAAGGLLLISTAVGNIVRFWGGIHNGSTAGSLTLQWAQSTSDAGNTTVMAGSYIKYQLADN